MAKVWESIRDLWISLPAGISVAVMGLLAALYPIITVEPIPPREKAAWTLLFFSLIVLEIFVIFKERSRQDQAVFDQLAKFQQIEILNLDLIKAVERVRNGINDGGLRDRAYRLSESLLEFASERAQSDPSIQASGMLKLSPFYTRSLPYRQSLLYMSETSQLYFDRFDEQVVGIRREFEGRNIRNDHIQEFATIPMDTANIQGVARCLADMAGRLSA